MFRLPVCPHCGTVYRYKDTREAIRKKENTCYHCSKKFKARMFPYLIIGAAVPLVLCVLTNMLILSRMTHFDLIPLFISTLSYLLIIYLIIPFFTGFIKMTDKEDKTKKKKKK